MDSLEREALIHKTIFEDQSSSQRIPISQRILNFCRDLIQRVHLFFVSPITRPSWIVYAGFFVSLSVSLFLLTYTTYYHILRVENDFSHDSKHAQLALEERVARYGNVLQATASLLGEKSHDIGWARWHTYVLSVIDPILFPGFWELSYIESVGKEKVKTLITSLNEEMNREIKLYPQNIGDAFYILKYACPTLHRQSALTDLFKAQGFNVASNASSRDALEKARDTGKPIATAPLYLVTDPEKKRLTFIVYHPVYASDKIPETVQERRATLKGWVSAPIDAEAFFTGIVPEGFFLNVTDADQKLFSQDVPVSIPSSLKSEKEFLFWGRPWLIKMASVGIGVDPFYKVSLIVIPIVGFLFSCATAFVLWSQTTTRRRAQTIAERMSANLRLSEMKNRTLLKSVPGAIFRCAPGINWKMDFVSDAIEVITGYDAEVFINQEKSYSDLLFEADIALVERTVGLVSIPTHAYDVEYRIHHRDGSIRWVSERGSVIRDTKTGDAHLTGTLFDVTERKRREADVRSLTTALQNAVEGILFITRDFTCRTVNESYASLFGRTADELIGTPWLKTFFQEDQEHIVDLCRNSGIHDRLSIDVRTSSDEVNKCLYLHVVMIAAIDGEGDVEGYYCFVRDVTQRIREEEALAVAVEEARSANRTKSEFLATMSHELRTPLNAIIGYSEILLEEVEDFEEKSISDDLKKINGAGRHLLELINDILDVSKLEAGKTTYHFEKFDVGKMISGIYDLMLPSAAKNKNQIKLKCPPDIGEMYSDYTKVRQGLFNLMSNAVKFTSKGIVTLKVELRTVERREFLAYSVSDSGCGITPEQLSKLFQPFTQADSSTTRQYGGTGLGLTITKRFCEELGGSVEVVSEKDVGSTFTLLLPRIASSSLVERLTKKDEQIPIQKSA